MNQISARQTPQNDHATNTRFTTATRGWVGKFWVSGLATLSAAAMIALPAAQSAANAQASANTEVSQAYSWASDGQTPLVVLGARLDPDCTPPTILYQRVNNAAYFAKQFPSNPVIVTGGYTQPGCQSEADAMKSSLRARGVTNPIYEETASHSTVENAQNVAAMRPEHRMILFTNSWHLARAEQDFADEGIQTRAGAYF